jgi:DinB family protein
VATRLNVYLECGAKRTFASALDWPGWCRQGPNETDALAALLAYGPKYASILARTGLRFVAPKDVTQLVVVERLPGTATTDFGAPSVAPTVDHDRSCDAADAKRFEKILRAGWRALDKAVRSARGKALATGPRGGGRSLEAIVGHIIGADAGYLTAVGWKAPKAAKPAEQLTATREAILAALKASAAEEIPLQGPRGGARWSARYFVRRVAWHVMAHAWEIERRAATRGR